LVIASARGGIAQQRGGRQGRAGGASENALGAGPGGVEVGEQRDLPGGVDGWRAVEDAEDSPTGVVPLERATVVSVVPGVP